MTEKTDISLKLGRQLGVEARVTSRFFQLHRRAGVVALCCTVAVLASVRSSAAATVSEVPGPMFTDSSPGSKLGGSSTRPKPQLDELVYKDGDRVRGHFVKRDGAFIIFQSERFGQLRVAATDAELVLAKPAKAVAAATGGTPKADVDVERAPFSPLAMAAALKSFFGSWHGRFAVAAEMMQDSSKHDSGTVEGHLLRKWSSDEVQVNGRYDYSASDAVTSTDMIKADGVWRHDLPHKLFGVYRPTLEWNRAYYRDGEPADYLLLQQELGAGINLFTSENRKLRTGVSENLFDNWVLPLPLQTHISQNVESVFTEVEAKLPWRIVLTDRGVYYYSFVRNTEGWENRFEIDKKLTETLTIGVRHEIRRNNPDVRTADYRRLRVLFGFDF